MKKGETTGTESTSVSGEVGRTSTSRKKSTNSAGQSKGLKEHWNTPSSVREFAAQANQVATMVLNGDIDKETARTYSALARVVAQATSIEVTRARFLKEAPDLSLGGSVVSD